MKNRLGITLAVCILLTGCTTLFQGVITVTEVVDSAMTNWAHLSNTQQTSAAFDDKVKVAHAKYNKSCAIAQQALILYKGTGQRDSLAAALQTVKEGAGPLIELIATVVKPREATVLKNNLTNASLP